MCWVFACLWCCRAYNREAGQLLRDRLQSLEQATQSAKVSALRSEERLVAALHRLGVHGASGPNANANTHASATATDSHGVAGPETGRGGAGAGAEGAMKAGGEVGMGVEAAADELVATLMAERSRLAQVRSCLCVFCLCPCPCLCLCFCLCDGWPCGAFFLSRWLSRLRWWLTCVVFVRATLAGVCGGCHEARVHPASAATGL